MKIRSWEDVDEALGVIAGHTEAIAEAKASIDEAKAEIADLEPRIEEWTREHEADLLERSLAVANGRVWLRKATHLETVGRRSWRKICEALVEAKRWTLVSTKRSVDKEALEQLPDEKLAELHVRRVTEDVFGYEAV